MAEAYNRLGWTLEKCEIVDEKALEEYTKAGTAPGVHFKLETNERSELRSEQPCVLVSKQISVRTACSLTNASFLHKSFSWGRFEITQTALSNLIVAESVFGQFHNLVRAFGGACRERNLARLIFYETDGGDDESPNCPCEFSSFTMIW